MYIHVLRLTCVSPLSFRIHRLGVILPVEANHVQVTLLSKINNEAHANFAVLEPWPMGDERHVIVGCAFLAVLWAKYADLLTANIASKAMHSFLQLDLL